MQDRPDAHELAAAVAQFLFEQVRPAAPPELRFQVLVAANACAILARELATAGWAEEEGRRLAGLLGAEPGDPGELRRQAADAIRAGALEDRWDEAVAVLRDSVRAKLRVAHPGYDEFADDGRG